MDELASEHPAYVSVIFAVVMIIAISIGVSVNAVLLWLMTHKKEDAMCSKSVADNEGERPALMT
jgi:multisubunit Na+/H+ antiporter MnhC subunit